MVDLIVEILFKHYFECRSPENPCTLMFCRWLDHNQPYKWQLFPIEKNLYTPLKVLQGKEMDWKQYIYSSKSITSSPSHNRASTTKSCEALKFIFVHSGFRHMIRTIKNYTNMSVLLRKYVYPYQGLAIQGHWLIRVYIFHTKYSVFSELQLSLNNCTFLRHLNLYSCNSVFLQISR